MAESGETPEPIEIPTSHIDAQTLAGVVEEFVLREGTDYGAHEVSLPQKVQQVLKQLEKGDVKIFFDPATETINLVPVQKG